ncbi:MAG: hypothetical protein ACI89T_000574 [Cognaticolwellia sp.]|jgi:hypothetical protein
MHGFKKNCDVIHILMQFNGEHVHTTYKDNGQGLTSEQ